MKKPVTPWLRAAAMIHARLRRSDQRFCAASLPADSWRNILKLTGQIDCAQDRGWRLAAHRQVTVLLEELEALQGSIAKLADQLREHTRPRTIASPLEIYRDLAALSTEFRGLGCGLEEKLISLTTEPIVLEGIPLGQFQIRLDIGQLPDVQHYSIVALEPNPARSDSSITHPHINDEELCAGDGLRAIRAALAAGRLYDFFSIVNQTLHTYAAGRAYVDLDNWYGRPCHDCGSTVDEDERYSCYRCEEILCGDCGCGCCDCNQLCCNNCAANCPRCERMICYACLQACRQCGTDVCRDCLTNNLCCECQNNETESAETSPVRQSPIEAAAPPAI